MDVIDAIIKYMYGAPLFLRRVAAGVVARNECVCGLVISHRCGNRA